MYISLSSTINGEIITNLDFFIPTQNSEKVCFVCEDNYTLSLDKLACKI